MIMARVPEIYCRKAVKFGANLEHIFNVDGFSILSIYPKTTDIGVCLDMGEFKAYAAVK